MARTAVEYGEELLAQEAARLAAERESATEDKAEGELAVAGPAVLELLNTVLVRLAACEEQMRKCMDMTMATRVRRPVRDELGTIIYVVDELQPPIWAQPMGPTPAMS